jgi:SAM-dependent methyltransferase
MMPESFEVNEYSDIYYLGGTYWNDLEVVQGRINERISGDPTVKWHEHFAREAGRTFTRALILNCGNGWVERELISYGLISEAVGMDYSESLLNEARVAARDAGMPLTYSQANVNSGAFPEGEFDLVVNHAAAHHIAAIDRVFREACRILPEDGAFVSMDYVGPHRLQYRLDAWEEVWRLNHELPESLRHELLYPPMPVALVVDPTEAIHSELILSTFHRYFTEDEFTPLGGAVAYPLLTHNTRLFNAEDDELRAAWIERILQADDDFLGEHPDATLFAYFAGRPLKSVLSRTDLLDQWEAEEHEREQQAHANGGEYYERGPLSTSLVALEEERALNAGIRTQIEQLLTELHAMQSRFLYSHARRAFDSKWVRAIRGNPAPQRPLLQATQSSERDGGEAERHRSAEDGAGPDHLRGALATALVELEAEKGEHSILEEQAEALRAEITALQSDPVYSTIGRAFDADLTRRLRATRAVANLERRVRAALRRNSA